MLTTINARSFRWLRLTDLYGRKVLLKHMPPAAMGDRCAGHGEPPMPIRRFLDGQPFDLETIRLMGLAFEMALAALRPTPDYADPLREVIARKIIELAKAGERDPERLCEGALSAASPADPSGWRGPLEGGQPPKPERRRSPIAIMEREK
jgi:hypothetical protein